MKRVFTIGNFRFTAITSRLIRIEYSDKKVFENHKSQVVINREPIDCECNFHERDDIVEITTSHLKLIHTKNINKLCKESLSISLNVNGEMVSWNPTIRDNANLKGTTRTLDNTNGEELELESGLLSKNGWYILNDSKSLVFNSSGWLQPRKHPDNVDWYFFGYGHDYKNALLDYTHIAGKIPIPPKYAFGYWWSRYWNYSDTELRELVNDFNKYDIPIDVLIIDMDWHKTYGLGKHSKNYAPDGSLVGWTGYTWNNDLFPEPKQLLDYLHKKGLKVALNLHPASGIAPMEKCYDAFKAEYECCDRTKYIPYRMADENWKDIYFKHVIKPLETEGVDFWWLDWQQFPTSKVIEGLNNTWWLNHVFFTEMEKSGKRPLLFHRWGGMGNHRYQVGFSGDTRASWESLQYQPYFTATASNVGYGYWSHDLGGHFPNGEDTNPELYLRWVQFGIVSPIVRTHCTKAANIERRFWKFLSHFECFKQAIHLRYILIPYIYNNAKLAHDSGISICRPMYYEHPDDDMAYEYKNQYYFGNDMIASPIVSPLDNKTQLAEKSTWLPDGEWFDWSSGKSISGNRVYTDNYSIDEIPLFIKAGSIIPVNNKIANTANIGRDIKFFIIPGESGETELYEDDGFTTDYLKGVYSKTSLKGTRESNKYTLEISNEIGSATDENSVRDISIEFINSFKPVSITLTPDKEFEVQYNPKSLSVTISFEKTASETINLVVEFPETETKLLNSVKRQFNRFNYACEKLKYEVARDDWSGTIPDSVNRFQQTLQRVEYNPLSAIEELSDLTNKHKAIIKDLYKHPSLNKEFFAWFELFTTCEE